MAFAKCIRFTLGKKGTTTEAIGFQGVGCEAAVNNFLGRMQAVPVAAPEYTADYHAAPSETEQVLEDPGA
jgi:hypothetical protein